MLYWNTVGDLLRQALLTLMQAPLFADFRLVGGTALSLHLGHRMSVDIDMFTDANHGSVDFDAVHQYLLDTFPFVQGDIGGLPGFGRAYLIGNSPEDHIKLDVYYSIGRGIATPVFQSLPQKDRYPWQYQQQIRPGGLGLHEEIGKNTMQIHQNKLCRIINAVYVNS